MRYIWSKGPYLLRPRHVFAVEGDSRKLRPVCRFVLVFLFLPFSELLLSAPIRIARCQPVTVRHCSGEKNEWIFLGALDSWLMLQFLLQFPASYAARGGHALAGCGWRQDEPGHT